jgi:hypothetical protein
VTDDQLRALVALRAVADAFLEAVAIAGEDGAPGGVLYAAAMGRLTQHQFEQIMAGLVRAGKLRKEGHVYFTATKVAQGATS